MLETSTFDDESPVDIVPVPSATSLLSLPFLDTLVELSLQSPNATFETDYEPFGHLILACTRLRKLELGRIAAEILVEPILQQISTGLLCQCGLTCITWDEIWHRTDPLPTTFDEILPHFATMPFLKQLKYIGLSLDYHGLRLQNTAKLLRLPSITALSICELHSSHTSHRQINHEVLQDLATYFPSLERLTVTLKQMTRCTSAYVSFTKLHTLSIIDMPKAESDMDLEVPLFRLIARDFAPRLRSLAYRNANHSSRSTWSTFLHSLEMAMESWDAQGIAETLNRVELQFGVSPRVYIRQGPHLAFRRSWSRKDLDRLQRLQELRKKQMAGEERVWDL